jgi:hypothetical protein
VDHIDAQLDILYQILNSLLWAGRLEAIDSLMLSIPNSNWPTVLLLGVLTISHCEKHRLHYYESFYNYTYRRYELEKGEGYVKKTNMLRGLEP